MKTNPYLNFDGQAEEAFEFYQSVFGGEITKMKFSEMPGGDQTPDNEKNRMMHISLPIGSSTVLMASDIMPSQGHVLDKGNHMYISLHPDSREEADRIFNGLSVDGNIEMPMEDQFWGDYFGSFIDKFGIGWMINYNKDF